MGEQQENGGVPRTCAVALDFACACLKMLSLSVSVVKFQFSVVFLLLGKFGVFSFPFFKELKKNNATWLTVIF